MRAYQHSFGLPATISNCSNNYGPFQFPEKVIPLFVTNLIDGGTVPLYGDGLNVRDWLHVEDHCHAIWTVIERGRSSETYNVGGNNQVKNIDVVRRICELVAEETQKMATGLGLPPGLGLG